MTTTTPLGKYMVAEREPDGSWIVSNKRSGDMLGAVEWYPTWKEHIFWAHSSRVVMSSGCLAALVKFLEKLNAERPNR